MKYNSSGQGIKGEGKKLLIFGHGVLILQDEKVLEVDSTKWWPHRKVNVFNVTEPFQKKVKMVNFMVYIFTMILKPKYL